MVGEGTAYRSRKLTGHVHTQSGNTVNRKTGM